MHKRTFAVFLVLTLLAAFFIGGSRFPAGQKRTTIRQYLLPEPSGTVTYESGRVSVDASNVSEGYVMVRHQGGVDKVKLRVTAPDQVIYTYTLTVGSLESFPLPGGNGTYHLEVLEHIYDTLYTRVFSLDFDVTLSDEFRPFLYPNQYVRYSSDSAAVAKAAELSARSSNDLDFVKRVYHYITRNIAYDYEFAESMESDYLSDADRTLNTGKGICLDYAALMAAMLRSQGIPTKLVVGYRGENYHAWVSVYLPESGWVDMDPTRPASRGMEIDSSDYRAKFFY